MAESITATIRQTEDGFWVSAFLHRSVGADDEDEQLLNEVVGSHDKAVSLVYAKALSKEVPEEAVEINDDTVNNG